jgi:hypothetical protein
MKLNRAQGTIEYLLIIAVVVVIALVVVSLLTGFLDNTGGIDEQSTKIYWSSQPVAITDSLADNNGSAQIVVKNNTDGIITLNRITANDVPTDVNGGTGKEMPIGSTYTATITGIPECIQQKQTYVLTLNYTSRFGLSKTVGPSNLVVPCTDNIIISVSVGEEGLTIETTDGVSGALPVYNGSDWVFSYSDSNGIGIDGNTLCFGGSSCDGSIDWNGTDLILTG